MNDLLDAPQQQLTEENVRYAGFLPRFGASIIDGFLIWLVTTIFNLITIPTAGGMVVILLGFLATTLYQPIMEGAFGATLGKKWTGLRVVNKQFGKINYVQAFSRNIVHLLLGVAYIGLYLLIYFDPPSIAERYANAENIGSLIIGAVGFIYFIDFLVFLNDPKHRALHDMIAGT